MPRRQFYCRTDLDACGPVFQAFQETMTSRQTISLKLSQLASRLGMSTIRNRLLVAFLLMVLIPAVAFGAVTGLVGLRSGRQQVIDKLTSVVALKEAELNTWAKHVNTDLTSVMIGDGVQQAMRTLLAASTDPEEVEAASQNLYDYFDAYVQETGRFDELFLMDLSRRVVISTDREREGGPGSTAVQTYFERGMEGEYLHPPSHTLAALTGQGVGIVVVRPVKDDNEQIIGIIAGRTGPGRLSEIMLEHSGLGETGETYLVASNQVMLTEPRFPVENLLDANYVFSVGAQAAVQNHESGSGRYVNHRGVQVIGVYRWLPDLKVALLAEQAENEAMGIVYKTFAINVGVTLMALLMAVGISLLLARSIANPLSDLARTATRVSDGELDLLVSVTNDDEIGAVARAFNHMTVRLRDLIGGLESRVEERTQTLHRRALQLETSVQVSHEITAILSIDELLARVVALIAGTFGYYHVGIFLLDREVHQLVFRAGAGEVDSPERLQNSRIHLGEGSLNGEVAARNQVMVVNDVRAEPRFLGDEMLPATQSELVIPLRVGDRVIGTLDVQSKDTQAFGDQDVRVLQGLGDQVSIAIENARLYGQARALAVVEERTRLARDLHDSVAQSLYGLVAFAGAGSNLVAAGDIEPLEAYLARMEKTAQQALNEMRLLLYELRPPTLEQEGFVGALRTRLDAVEGHVGIQAELKIEETIQLSPRAEEVFYRVAQEALNNVLKHSAASAVSVQVQRVDRGAELRIVDNGVGFDVSKGQSAGGLGLVGMQERAAELGGALTVQSALEEGTTVCLRVDNRFLTKE